MPKTKRVIDEDDEAKKPSGRPRVLSPDLNWRHQLRCNKERDFDAWVQHSIDIGFPNVSAWLRKVANDALPKKMRQRRAG